MGWFYQFLGIGNFLFLLLIYNSLGVLLRWIDYYLLNFYLENYPAKFGVVWNCSLNVRTSLTLNKICSYCSFVYFVSRKSKEFLNAVNHPSLLSPEERVLYRSRARQKLKAMMAKNSATVTVVNKRLNRCLTHKWQSANRPSAENKLQQGLKLTVAEYAITHKANNQLVRYPDTAVGFLRFCRNLEVHMVSKFIYIIGSNVIAFAFTITGCRCLCIKSFWLFL